jgi:hypothetical protein
MDSSNPVNSCPDLSFIPPPQSLEKIWATWQDKTCVKFRTLSRLSEIKAANQTFASFPTG